MTSTLIARVTTYPYFSDIGGRPLVGRIFVGVPNTDPRQPANQIGTYFDAAGAIPAAQPLAVLSGHIMQAGSPTDIFVAQSPYSIYVTDLFGNKIYYNPTASDFNIAQLSIVLSSVAAIRTLPNLTGQTVTVSGYYKPGDGGGGLYWYDPTDTTTADNGGTVIVSTAGGRWKLSTIGPVTTKQFGAVVDGQTDDTTFIQNWINWLQSSGWTGVPSPGKSKITTLTITSKVTITAPRGSSVFLLSSPNQNGITIGDGTTGTAGLLSGTHISGLGFNPFNGVAASTSGACIYRNTCNSVTLNEIDFYGANTSGTPLLWVGLNDFQTVECDALQCTFQQLLGDGIDVAGGTGLNNRAADCNYDNCRFIDITHNAVYWGANTAGLGMYRPEAYRIGQYCLSIAATSGASGQNYFVDTPDYEVDGAGGIYVASGENLIVEGGWVGGQTSNVRAVWLGVGSDSCTIGCSVYGYVQVDGQAHSILCPWITGDGSTTATGVIINSGANDTTVIGLIRQFTGNFIVINGTPTGLKIDVKSKNNTLDIGGVGSYGPAQLPPKIRVVTDKPYALTAAALLPLFHGQDVVQVTGATAITATSTLSQGSGVMLQAGAGGVTVNNGTGINLKGGTNATIPAFSVLKLESDGQQMFETGRNF